jgi:hypothetical protein
MEIKLCMLIAASITSCLILMQCKSLAKIVYIIIPTGLAVGIIGIFWRRSFFGVGLCIFVLPFLIICLSKSDVWPFQKKDANGPNAGENSQGQSKPYALYTAILYHGTPALENAKDILAGRGTFVIGAGNGCGTGLYMANFNTACTYAGNTGVILKIKLQVPKDQIIAFDKVSTSSGFTCWATKRTCSNFGDNISDYAITVLKRRFLKVNENLHVALAQRTQMNERVVFQGLTVLDVLDPHGKPINL